MSEFKQVEEERDLVRDMHSKAIINTNKSAYIAAVQRKKIMQCLIGNPIVVISVGLVRITK